MQPHSNEIESFRLKTRKDKGNAARRGKYGVGFDVPKIPNNFNNTKNFKRKDLAHSDSINISGIVDDVHRQPVDHNEENNQMNMELNHTARLDSAHCTRNDSKWIARKDATSSFNAEKIQTEMMSRKGLQTVCKSDLKKVLVENITRNIEPSAEQGPVVGMLKTVEHSHTVQASLSSLQPDNIAERNMQINIEPICTISPTETSCMQLNSNEVKRLKWKARKDKTNKEKREKYASLKKKKQFKLATKRKRKLSDDDCAHTEYKITDNTRQKKYTRSNLDEEMESRFIKGVKSMRKRRFGDETELSTKKTKICTSDSKESQVTSQKSHSSKISNEPYAKLKPFIAQLRTHIVSKSARYKLGIAKKICDKYKRARNTVRTMKVLLVSKEQYVTNITKALNKSSIESRMDAEWIIKWCFHVREKYLYEIQRYLQTMKEKVEVCLTQLTLSTSVRIEDKITALCGSIKKHTASSEAYFVETAYIPLRLSEAIILNKNGQTTNVFPLISGKNKTISWACSSLCQVVDDKLINTYNQFLQKINDCTLRNIHKVFPKIHKCTVTHHIGNLGHSHTCYIFPTICKSDFISVEFLSPHFPNVRVIKRLFYKVLSSLQKLNDLDKALDGTNIEILRKIAIQAQQKSNMFESTDDINLIEDSMINIHFEAFKLLTKSSMDVPRFDCISCEKLCFKKDISKIENLKSRITSPFWTDLIKHIRNEQIDAEFICHYCLNKFRIGKLPPTCILNKLVVVEVPEVISNLNDYEKLLIQRAKAFQIVQKMGTVAKKNMPHRDMNKKIIGRTFHLPLPIEETLKKICPAKEAINLEHELYILIRGIPTKAKVVWESLVNLQKVFDCLVWLKENNPIYSEIQLPKFANLLMDERFPNAEFKLNDNSFCLGNEPRNTKDDSTDIEKERNVLLTQISRSDSQKSILGEDKQRENEIKDLMDVKGNDNNSNGEKIEKEQKAMLTQKSQSDSYYEQFTIHPMYSDKENKTATELYQMLKVQDLALDYRYKALDLKCYPDLYPYGVNGQREERLFRLTEFEFIKAKLMSKHPQFRLNQQYLFFLLNDNNIRQLNSGIFHKMNVTNAQFRYTAGSYLEQLAKGELEGNLNTIFSRLRNTEQFWRKPRSNLNCMIQHYGPATWFLTLSPCEYLWSDLIQYLREVNPSMSNKSPNSLIAADPVSVSRFMDNKFRAMLHFICSKSNPIGEVIHYFWRREYQTRGTQHFHLLIWIKDAPILGKSSTEEVAAFISKYATCRIPNKNISPTLHRRVMTHQHHNHNSYCMRSKKTKNRTIRACRFGFPRPVTNSLIMRDVASAVAGRRQLKYKSRLYDLPRSNEETCINDYNPVVLTAWEGNMDIQFVGEKSALLTWYCTKYISKAEKSYATEIFERINSTKSLMSRLWNVALRMLCNRECGAPEAADTLLGFSLYGTDQSTTVKWIDVNILRSKKLKPHKDIKIMNKDSTDIFYHDLVDYYYPMRPAEIDRMNLYDFTKWYDILYTKPKDKVEYYALGDGKFLKRRRRGHLINHYKNDVDTQPEKYFYALLLLFQPWRDVDELKNGRTTYAESFLSIESELIEALQYHERLSELKENFECAKLLIEKQIAENINQTKNVDGTRCDDHELSLSCNPIEADEAMKDFNDLGDKDETANLVIMISELNADQKRIFDRVTNTINSDKDILKLYISGEGGTGKSFLIKTIRCWIKQTLGKDTAVTAPTGIAAFNIDGLTIHRLFQLPVEHGKTPKYRELSDSVLKTIREQLQNVSLIIIDEVSMVSNVTLLYIHLRLTEIFNTSNVDDGWFGKKHVLLFGDLLQLPPVREEPAFIKLSVLKTEQLLESLGSVDIWQSLFSYDELSINMRQKNDSSYREMLSRIRLGMVTTADANILGSRKIKFTSMQFSDRIQELSNYINELPSDTVCLLPTCYLCDVLNDCMISRIPSEEILLIARDSIDCAPRNKKKALKFLECDNEDSSRTAGLAKNILIKIGAKVMLRRNIDITLGLVNGTIGTIISVSRELDKDDVDKVKIVLTTGLEYEIKRVSVKFQIMDGVYVNRRQFPLCLSYGITIHKSQGLSLNNAVVDAGNSIFSCGQVYVALSRVTSLEGLHLINFDPYSVKAHEFAIIEYNRLRQLYRPDLMQIKFSKKRAPKVPDFLWAVPKSIIECQQLPNNAKADDIVWHVNGLQNIDGVSCYANSIIQCILNCQCIRDRLTNGTHDETNAMVGFLHNYIGRNNNLDSFAMREFVGEPFINNKQHDASNFFMGICNKSDVVTGVAAHKLTIKIRCQACQYTDTREQLNNILLLTLPSQNKKVLTLQEVIEYSLSQWTSIEGPCYRCNAMNRLMKTIVSTTNQVLILQLKLMTFNKDTSQLTKTNFSIKSVPTTTITVCGEKYKVKSALFHHGPTFYEGHYTSLLRSGTASSWILVDDMKIEKKGWPRNAKNGYMFFLEKITK